MAEDPAAAYAELGAVAARAVVANAIPRTVFQSSVGAERRHGVGEIDGLGRAEELLDATGASVLHLRCGYFFPNLTMQLDNLRDGVVPVLLPVDHPMPGSPRATSRRSRRCACCLPTGPAGRCRPCTGRRT